jgi:hypothetical protein
VIKDSVGIRIEDSGHVSYVVTDGIEHNSFQSIIATLALHCLLVNRTFLRAGFGSCVSINMSFSASKDSRATYGPAYSALQFDRQAGCEGCCRRHCRVGIVLRVVQTFVDEVRYKKEAKEMVVHRLPPSPSPGISASASLTPTSTARTGLYCTMTRNA